MINRFLLILWGITLSATPIGNPSIPSILEEGFFLSDASWTNFQCGFFVDWLEQQRFGACTSSKSIRLRKAELQGSSQAGTLTWCIGEQLNLQLEIGGGKLQWRWEQESNMVMRGHLSGGILWSGDAKVVIFEIKDTSFSVDVHAGGWSQMKGHATSNGVLLKAIAHSEMRYWQVGTALCQKIGLFLPYMGVAANRTRLKIRKLEPGVGWLRSRYPLGPFLGCTLSTGTDIALNIEWRGGFEQGVSLSGQFRF